MTTPAAIVTVTVFAVLAPSLTQAGGKHDHIGEKISELPIFDAHMHYDVEAWEPVPPKAVLTLMDDSGVTMALVSSTPDDGTVRLLEFAPNRIVPELRPYHGDVDSRNWTRAPGMFDYLSRRLADHPHEGIGEFHLHDVTIDDEPLLRQIADVAAAHDLLIHVHSRQAAVELLYGMRPDLRILWAHAGMTEPPAVIEAMMEKYDSLHADTSYREADILSADGAIDPNWRHVIERFPDRFLVGSDTWTNSQWAEYRDLIQTNRRWLSQFARPIAEAIAYRNAERLFGRKQDNSLLGTR